MPSDAVNVYPLRYSLEKILEALAANILLEGNHDVA